MDKITRSLVNSFSTQFELDKIDESIRFEHFSNYCITSKNYRGSFELEDIHTGSGGDSAIDGMCLIVNARVITDEDELVGIIENAGYLDADITFIQSKTSSSFDGSEIGSFIHGVKDFLSDTPRLVQNEKIQKMKVIWERLLTMSSFMINRRPKCKLYYVTTGRWLDDQNLLAVIDLGVREIGDINIFENISIDPLGASDIQRLYNETKNKLQVTVNFQNRITLPDIEGISEAYLGVIPFVEYLKLIQDENGTILGIFDDNVRDFQGNNTVNKKIKNTLDEGKFDLFCVLNNGVTVVASSLTPAANRFTLRDYQVVNGCQTSHVLYENKMLPNIGKVFVPIKVIVTDNDDIKTSITLATNSQTEVRSEQLEALNAFQRKLELYYNAEKSTIQLYYERRSQQYNSIASIKRTQVITIPIQIKSFASVFLKSPHLVSGYYGTIVNRFSGKIFAEDHNYSPYYVSSLCYYRIEQYFRSGDLDPFYKKARYHLMMLVRLLAMGEHLAPFNSYKMGQLCDLFKDTLLDDAQSLGLYKGAVQIFDKSLIDRTKSQYKSETDTDLLIQSFRNYGKK